MLYAIFCAAFYVGLVTWIWWDISNNVKNGEDV